MRHLLSSLLVLGLVVASSWSEPAPPLRIHMIGYGEYSPEQSLPELKQYLEERFRVECTMSLKLEKNRLDNLDPLKSELVFDESRFSAVLVPLEQAGDEWWSLGPDDWQEAFRHHPRIGDRASLAARFPETHALSAREQSGIAGAAEDVLDALAERNRTYEDRFGYTFIVCATGKTADEMLARLRARLRHAPEAEIRVAAEEQARITALRLGGGA